MGLGTVFADIGKLAAKGGKFVAKGAKATFKISKKFSKESKAILGEADDLAKTAGKSTKKLSKLEGLDLLKKTKGVIGTKAKVLAAISAGVGATILGKGVADYARKNGKEFKIVKIEDSSSWLTSLATGEHTILITVEEEEEFTTDDTITLSGTTCDPSLNTQGDDQIKIINVVSKTQIEIAGDLEKNQIEKGGIMTLHTDLDDAIANSATDIVESPFNLAFNGLKSIFGPYMWIIELVFVIIIAIIVIILLNKLRGTSQYANVANNMRQYSPMPYMQQYYPMQRR